MMSVQDFLEQYAKEPIGEIDVERAKEILRRAGVLTKDNRISKRYSGAFIIREDSILLKGKRSNRQPANNED